MRAIQATPDPLQKPPAAAQPVPVGFHGAVSEFKRRLIEATLTQLGGNRTQAARALGLQRTYLLRLIRVFGVNVPRRARRLGGPAHAAREAAVGGGRSGEQANGVDTRRRAV